MRDISLIWDTVTGLIPEIDFNKFDDIEIEEVSIVTNRGIFHSFP